MLEDVGSHLHPRQKTPLPIAQMMPQPSAETSEFMIAGATPPVLLGNPKTSADAYVAGAFAILRQPKPPRLPSLMAAYADEPPVDPDEKQKQRKQRNKHYRNRPIFHLDEEEVVAAP